VLILGANRWICALVAISAALVFQTAALAECGDVTASGARQIVIKDRAMVIRLPAGYDPDKRYPLLFILHGSNGTGAGVLATSGLAATADRHGFIIAAPDGGITANRGFVWNIPGVPSVTGKIPTAEDPDDTTFLQAAADRLVAQACVDASRVYATGISGGGRMSSWLACVAADRFAAIAPVVGLRAGNPMPNHSNKPDPATCRPSRPVPVIAFAGDKDTTNPVEGGGASYWQYSMREALARWASLNGCAAAPNTRRIASNLTEQSYSGCHDDAEVVARMTEGGGHVWLADNEVMWAFLSRHHRN